MMNPIQKTYFKYLIIVVLLWVVNYFLNPLDNIAVILNWVFLISFAALVMLYFDARKQYDKDGKKVIDDSEDVNYNPEKDDTKG